MGIEGLFHHKWFRTSGGRFGGATDNVPETFPGSLRCNLRFGGGLCPEGNPEENEGYAIVKEFGEMCRSGQMEMYRKVQMYSLSHVVADGGEIIVSPIGENNVVYMGFVGRCMFCPNAEDISFQQLKAFIPDYSFQLFPEWRNWRALFS